MKIDYLIIGNGLAGIMLCETLRKLGKSFRLISDNSQQASIVASGLYNPVVLKRFNKVWNADKQLPLAMSVYENLESFLKIKIDTKIPIYRVFHSEEEQNNWFISCDSLELEPFLTPKIIDNHNKNIKQNQHETHGPMNRNKGLILNYYLPMIQLLLDYRS